MTVGKYIVIEGHDGTGKSTQVEIIRKRLMREGIDSIEFHEPAGNPIADEIRTILKNGELERHPKTDMLLFSAARCDLWNSRALIALKLGEWVVTSRSYFSTLAYQGYGENLDLDMIENITSIATDERYMIPDFATILDLNSEERRKRIRKRGELEVPDNFESKDDAYQTRVQEGYLDIAKKRNVPVISANQPPNDIADDIWVYLKELI